MDIHPRQTFAFKDELVTRMYKRKIKNFKAFHLKNSGNFFDYNSTGTIEFWLFLPFTNGFWTKWEGCWNSSHLPEFFANKTEN